MVPWRASAPACDPASASHVAGWRRAFTFPVFLGAVLVLCAFASARIVPPQPDTWWHIAVGERILKTGTWPTADPYSHTASGSPWIAYEWLGEVGMALAARGGPRAQMALQVGIAALFLLLLFADARQRSGSMKASFVACAAALPAATFFFALRPQILGYVFLSATLLLLRRFRQGRQRTLWLLPVVFLLWANTHGSFAFGLFAVGVYWAAGLWGFQAGGLVAERWTGVERRHLALIFLVSLLATTLTPYGTRVAAYPLEMALLQPVNVANIEEWQALSPDVTMGKLFLGFLLLFVAAQVVLRPSYRPEELALLGVAVFAAATHRRFLLLFLVVFVPLLAELLARFLPRYEPARDRPALNAVLIGLIVAAVVAFFPTPQAIEQLVARHYPVGATEYLRQHSASGNLLNEYSWGGYLIWALGPERPVFIDGRADLYEYGGVLADYLGMTRLAPDTLRLLEKYHVQVCLLRQDAPLATLLRAMPNWESAYSDPLSIVLVRKGIEISKALPARTDNGMGTPARPRDKKLHTKLHRFASAPVSNR